MDARLGMLRKEMEQELQSILSFWIRETVDEANDGFFGEISNELAVNQNAAKGLVLNTRILWTFATAYRLSGNAII